MIPSFSTNFGSRKLIYALDMPSFQRDFASLKTLDHGTGPSITFTRNSNATFFDADGVLQTAATNAPRFDHDPATGASRGLLIEEARTNSIRNSQAGGAVAGTPGTVPTNWAAATPQHGLSRQIVATGTVNGLPYIDIRYSGTTDATNGNAVFFEGAGTTAAASGQTWTASAYFALVAGGFPNQLRLLVEGTNGTTRVEFGSPANIAGGVTSSLQRFTRTYTLADATTTHVRAAVDFNYSSGVAVDFTLRIAAPQLEQGAFPTSYIPTTTAAVTRSADSAVVTPISSFYNQAEGTLFVEGSSANTPNALNALVSIDDTTADERIQIRRGTQFNLLNAGMVAGGVPQATLDTATNTWTSPTEFKKIAYAFKENDLAVSMGGASALTDSSATLPTVTRVVIGFGPNSQYANGHIRKIAYYPRRLSNTLLQQLTT